MVGWSSRLEVIPFKAPRNVRHFKNIKFHCYNIAMTTTLHWEKSRAISVKGKSVEAILCA